MVHHFETHEAEKYGLIEAIILSNLRFWIARNKANSQHFHDGRTWTYNSISAWTTLFPYLSPKKVRRALESLATQGVIKTGQYSENPWDRTLWYALADEESMLDPMAMHAPLRANTVNAFAPEGKCTFAPEGKSLIGADNNTDTKQYISLDGEFEAARKLFPGTKAGHTTEFDRLKKKHKDWRVVVPLLRPAIEREIQYKALSAAVGAFVPSWKHLSTWLNQRCWEQEFGAVEPVAGSMRETRNGAGRTTNGQAQRNEARRCFTEPGDEYEGELIRND